MDGENEKEANGMDGLGWNGIGRSVPCCYHQHRRRRRRRRRISVTNQSINHSDRRSNHRSPNAHPPNLSI